MSSDLDEDPIVAATKANEANGHVSNDNMEKDLFGDDGDSDDDDIGTARKRRKLSDDELASGDDLEQDDPLEEDQEEERAPNETREINVLAVELPKAEFPSGSDGEVYLYRNPQSIGIEPHVFNHQHFELPRTTHHSKGEAPANFSAAHTAANTIRWRRSPNDMNEMQSNARIIRWSDGSLTMQIGSNATEQYELTAKALAPPQSKPVKPTPVSNARSVAGKYDAKQDSHTYLASVHLEAGFAQITNHVTASLSVVIKNEDEDDEALARLQQSMAAAISQGKPNGQGPGVIMITEDPELAKKRAETAERDRAKALKRRQVQEERDRDRNARVLGKAGFRQGGLTSGFLDDDGEGVPRRAAPRKPRRRGSEYSDDEDGFDNRRRTKEDDYDEDDGFLVKSDEEDEEGDAEGSEESEEEDVLDDRPARPSRAVPERETEPEAENVPVEREPAGEDGENVARGRHRRVVDDDDDE